MEKLASDLIVSFIPFWLRFILSFSFPSFRLQQDQSFDVDDDPDFDDDVQPLWQAKAIYMFESE